VCNHFWRCSLWSECAPVSSVGIATGYGLDGPGIESLYLSRDRIPVPVQTGPGAHPASCTMGTRCFLGGVKSGRGVTLTPHPLLVSLVMKKYSYTSTPPYGAYGLYRATVPVQGCTLPYSRAIPLLPLWAVRPVQSHSACTRVTFTLLFFMKLKRTHYVENVSTFGTVT